MPSLRVSASANVSFTTWSMSAREMVSLCSRSVAASTAVRSPTLWTTKVLVGPCTWEDDEEEYLMNPSPSKS
jgi:hypothetical protein